MKDIKNDLLYWRGEIRTSIDAGKGDAEEIEYEKAAFEEICDTALLAAELFEPLKEILDYHTTAKPWPYKQGDMTAWILKARAVVSKAEAANGNHTH